MWCIVRVEHCITLPSGDGKMAAIDDKPRNQPGDLRRYRRVFIPLGVILAVMVYFPVRIDLSELFYDALFYGTISLICMATAFHVYLRFRKHGRRLIAIMLLCSLLSGWQIVDLYVVRTGSPPSPWGFGHLWSRDYTDLDGLGWYRLRFPSDSVLCHTLYERYWGNHLIAITVEIKRNATWFACGG